MSNTAQDIANQLKTELGKTTINLSGDTKKVSIRVSALTRVEYSETITVPVEFDDSVLEVVVDSTYDELEGDEYCDDPDYWERGSCRHVPVGD